MKHASLAVLIGLTVVIGCNPRFDFDVPFEAGTLSCTDKCAQWHQVCEDNWQVCVECNVNNDCMGNANGSRCSITHRCVQTSNDDDVCGSDGQKCGTQGNCLECSIEDDCSVRGEHCLSSCGYCVECRYDSDCMNRSDFLCDPVLHQCVSCTDGRYCSSGCCDLSAHQCY